MLILLIEPTIPIVFQFPSSRQILNTARLLAAGTGVAACHLANVADNIMVSIIRAEVGYHRAYVGSS